MGMGKLTIAIWDQPCIMQVEVERRTRGLLSTRSLSAKQIVVYRTICGGSIKSEPFVHGASSKVTQTANGLNHFSNLAMGIATCDKIHYAFLPTSKMSCRSKESHGWRKSETERTLLE